MRINSIRVIFALMVLMLPGFAQESEKKASRSEGESAVLTKIQPEYPAVAKQLKIQGIVELEAVVAGSGEVEKVSILSGSPVLTKPASEAVKKWKFRPFTVDGKAVTARVPVTISFKL
jgi:periplasmic protein TonB